MTLGAALYPSELEQERYPIDGHTVALLVAQHHLKRGVDSEGCHCIEPVSRLPHRARGAPMPSALKTLMYRVEARAPFADVVESRT